GIRDWSVTGVQTCALPILLIGIHQRERERIELEMNERLAAIKAEYEHRAEPHRRTIEEQISGLRTWCEAHRDHLLSGDSKTYRRSEERRVGKERRARREAE